MGFNHKNKKIEKYSSFKKKIIITIVSSMSIGLICFIGGNYAINKEYILDVASTKVTIEEYNQLLLIKKYILGKQIGFENINPSLDNQIKEELITSIAQDEILYQISKKENVFVNEKEIDKQFELYKNFINDEEYVKYINNNKINDDIIKNFIEKDLYSKKYIDKITSKIDVSEKEILDYYEKNKNKLFKVEEVNVSHILLKTYNENKKELSIDKKKEIKNNANDVLVQLKNGSDFEELAKKYSEDEGTSSNGGNLGYFGKDVMVKEFDDIVFKMKKGEISEVFETAFGYHIVKLNDIRETQLKLDDVKEIIINNLKIEKSKNIVLNLVSDYPLEVYRK